MKIKQSLYNTRQYEKAKVLKISVISIFIVVGLMTVAYICVFAKNGISEETSDWANFGSYLGSVTGLLAFAGVLYSASLSIKRAEEDKNMAEVRANEEKSRANKVEQVSIKREERDQLFKMLELLREQSKELTLKNSTTNKSALEIFVKRSNNLIISGLIYYFILDITKDKWDEFRFQYDCSNLVTLDEYCYDTTKPSFFNSIVTIFIKLNIIYNSTEFDSEDTSEYVSDFVILDKLKEKLNFKDVKKLVTEDLKTFPTLYNFETLYSFSTSGKLEMKFCYTSLTGSCETIFQYSAYDKYCNTCVKIINMIDEFSNDSKNNHFEILKTQIAGSELIMLLFYILSNRTSKEFAQKVLDNHIFSNLCNLDFFFTNKFEFRGKEEEYVSEILNLYLEDKYYS